MKSISVKMDTYILQIPSTDKNLFEALAQKMSWITSKEKTGVQKGLEDVKEGRIYSAKDSQDLVKQILD